MSNKWIAEDDAGGEYIFGAGAADQFFSSMAATGATFNGGYVGLSFMKNVFCLSRDFWHNSLSTPYSGQLWPTGGKTGGPGQVFPF